MQMQRDHYHDDPKIAWLMFLAFLVGLVTGWAIGFIFGSL